MYDVKPYSSYTEYCHRHTRFGLGLIYYATDPSGYGASDKRGDFNGHIIWYGITCLLRTNYRLGKDTQLRELMYLYAIFIEKSKCVVVLLASGQTISVAQILQTGSA